MEQNEKNPIEIPNITDDLNKLNQVVAQPDFTVSKPVEKQWGIPSTEDVLETIKPVEKVTPKTDPFLSTIKAAGFDASTNAVYRKGRDLSKYQDYVANTGFAINTPSDLLDSERALNQSNWEQAGNAVSRVIGNVIPEIGQQVSRMLDWTGDYSKDNAASQAFQSWKDAVNEVTPIYRENPDETFAFGDFAYWMDQGSNVATSALAFAAIGYATGGLTGSVLNEVGAMGARVLPNSLRTATGAQIANYVKGAGSAIATSKALTHAESVGVSIDTYNESFNRELQAEKANQEKTGKTDEEINLSARTKASKAAAFAYNMNQINFFLNLTSAFKFNALGSVGSRGVLATDSALGSALNTSSNTFKRELLKDGAHLALEAGQEYAEETVNYVAQRRGVEGAYNDSFSDIISKGLEEAKSAEGREAGFWGAIGGIAQSGFTSAGRYIPMYKNKAYEEAYSAERGRLAQDNIEGKNTYTREEIDEEARKVAEREAGKSNSRVSKHFIEQFREKQMIDARNEVLEQFAMSTSEDNTTADFTPESGEAIRQATNMLDTLEEQGRMFDEFDKALATNNIERAEEIRNKFTTRQIMESIENGTANTLERVYQGILNLTPAQAVEYGLSNDEKDLSYKESAKDAIAKLRRMENQVLRNNRYINSENINEVDADLITLSDSYKRILRNKLANIIPVADSSKMDVALQNLTGLTSNFQNNNDEGILGVEEIENYQRQIQDTQALYHDAKAEYNQALTENEKAQQEEAIKELDSLAKRINTLKEYRKQLTSKETQQTLREILGAVQEARMTMASNINDNQREDDNQTIDQNNQEGSNPIDTRTENTSESNITTPTESNTQISEQVSEPEIIEPSNENELSNAETTSEVDVNSNSNEVIEITSQPDVSVNVVDIFNLESNPFFSALLNKLGQSNPFIKAYSKFITDQLTTLKQRQDDNTNVYDVLNKVIFTFRDNIIDSVVAQEMFLQDFPSIRPSFESDPSIISTINNFFTTEADRFSTIRDSIENLNTALTDLVNINEDPNIVVSDDEKSESFDEDAYSEDNPFDIDQQINNQQPSALNFKSTSQMVVTISSLLNTLDQNGIPIRSWNDFYIQLVNASSKDVVNSVLPRLKNIWEFIVKDNVLNGTVLSENDYQIDESLSNLDTLAETHELDQGWGDNKANSIVNQLGDVINDIVQSTPTNSPILVRSGSGLKSNTIFKLAYAAREYVVRTVMKDGLRIDSKQDFDDSLNNNNDYELFDTANLVPGTELVLIPLNIGEEYSYYNPRDGKKYTFIRRSVDKVARIIDNGQPEILDAVDHMPIFISKSTNRKDIIDGTFLHLPEWANTDNMAGDNVEVKLQEQMIRSFREKVINNVNKKGGNKKLIRIKIQNKTAGIPITSRGTYVKASERITENIPLAIQLESGLQTKPGESAIVINDSSKLPLGTVFALLPTPVGQIAYPLQRTRLKDTNLKQSIITVLDLFFTVNENLTDKQKRDIQAFKQLGLDVKSFSAVRTYLNNILYTGHLRNINSNNKLAFEGLINSTIEQFRGKSIFRLGTDSANQPYLQFGRIGTEGAELSFETFAENRDDILNLLGPVLDNAYPNASLEYTNTNKKILGVKEVNGEYIPSVLYNNYNEMLKDTSVTSLSPKVITNPKTGKDKTIYTFQQTISFENPEVIQVNNEGQEISAEAPVDIEERKEGKDNKIDLSIRSGNFEGDFLNNYDFIAEGSESTVYRSKDGTHVIKISEPYSSKDESLYERRINNMLQREILGNSGLEVIGYYDFNGAKNPIFRQNFIDGNIMSEQDVISYLKSLPDAIELSDGNIYIKRDNVLYKIQDFTDNAIIDNNGNINFIDVDVSVVTDESLNNEYDNIDEINNTEIIDEEEDFFDTDDDGLYSFDSEAEEDITPEYTFEEAIAPYTYIPGINNLIQNSVVFQAINNIYSSITEQNIPKGIETSVNETLTEISKFYNDKYEFIQKRINANKFPSEEAKNKAISDLNAVREKIDLLITNKDKIIDRVKLVMKQEGLSVRLTGKAKKKYLEKVAKQKDLNEDEKEAEDLGLEPIRDIFEKESLLEIGEVTSNEEDEILDTSDEDTEELSFDKDAMTINPTASLTQELKQFFNSVKQTVFDGENFVQKKNFLGLYNTVPFNTVFQKVQELLAQYPTEDYKEPTIEKFIQVLKDNQRKSPYLTDIINRLEDPKTTEDFKNAFVLGMYKMYNNTVFTNITYNQIEDEESAFYSAAVTAVTDNNVVSLLMNQWNEELEAQGILEDITQEDGRSVRVMNNIVRNQLQNLYFGIPSSKTALQDFVKLYKTIGVTIPLQMVNDLANGILKYRDSYYDVKAFSSLPVVKYSIESIIGNPLTGDQGIVDANTDPVYSNSAFISLAKIISTYEDNLTTNSSRNLNGDMIFNMSEVKNLVESFFSAKDINKLISQMKDPYHRITYNPNKKLKTWREQLLIQNGDSYALNTDSNFARSFRYYTLSGTKVKDSNGTTVMEIESMSENDHILDHILLYINQAKSIGSGNNLQHLAIYPYLTMSDKKVPMAFSAPSVRFLMDIFNTRLDNIPNQQLAQQQIDYLYEVMLMPDIRRMEYLDNNPSINIKEYSKENAKFYTLPSLNLIDFDYIDGDINNEKDTTNTLRSKLGLTPDQNLFEFRGIGSNTERVINMNVLKKPEVIVYLKQKMIDLFNQNAQETFTQLENAGLISIIRQNNDVSYVFNDNSKIDIKTLRNLGFETSNATGVEEFIYDYSVNKMLAYAQMQDLLIGDPIQYAKPSAETKAIKKELKEINEQRAQLILNVDEQIVTEQEANEIRKDLSRKESDARYRLIRATGQQDVLSANDNQGKRLASDNASGQKVVAPASDSHYNMLVMTDVNIGVSDRDFYYKYLVPNTIKQMADSKEKTDMVNKILEKYLEIDQADAQEFTTLKEHLNTMVYLQEISREEADRILKDDNNGNLKPTDYSTILQSMKMVYASNFERDNINSKLYVKSSSFPLSNTFVKGLPIEDLYKHMVNNNIHRATFKTAVKVGSPITTAPVFNTDGTVNKEALRNTEPSIIRNIPRTGHKKQQNVPYKEDKHQLNDGTQKAKMIFVNLMDTPGFKLGEKTYNGRQLHDEYVDTYREMYRLKAEELRAELYPQGINAGINYKVLHNLILNEAESRGYSENDIAFLQLNNEETDFLFPLWLSGNEKKLSSLLNSIVDNRIRKRKREGISGVLVSDIAIATNPEYKSNITYTTMNRGNQLRSMRDVNGKITEAEVIVPFRFRDNKGKKLNLTDFTYKDADGNTLINNEKVPSDVLDIIGFRIPTQGLNSMIAIKIVGFLPEGYENVVIAPVDVVAQMGSDFDVDKMFQDYVNTTYEDGKLRRLTQTDVYKYEQVEDYKRNLKALKQAKLYGDDVRVGIISKQLETLRQGRTQQEMLDMGKSIPKNLKMRLLEDKIFDIQKAILMNPHSDVQSQRVQPIDSATFVNITKIIMPQVFDSKLPDNWTPYNTGYQIKKYLNARGGKVGVSTWSSTSVLNAVLQGIDFKSNPMYLQTYDRETKSYIPMEYTFLGQKSNYINNPKGDKGHFKSDIIQALQSITVDNENLQIMHKLNLNEYTNDFIRAAILLGYDESSIFYFINHPVVKEIVKGKTNKTAIKKPKNTYKDGEKEIEYSQTNMFNLIGNMKPQQLIDDIQNNYFNENDVNHYAIYAFFMEMSKHGKTFKSLESLLNVDSKGIGSNLFYSLEKEKALLNLKDNTQISNINKVLGDFAPTYAQTDPEGDITSKEYQTARSNYNQDMRSKGYVELQNAWFLPKTIPAMAAGFALVTNNRLWSKSFPYSNNTIANITGLGLALENNKNNDQLYSLASIIRSGETFINNDIQEDSIGTASPTKDSEIKQMVVEHFKSYLYSKTRNDMTMTNDQLVESLESLKEMIPNNLFLKKLAVEKISRESDVNIIVFDAGSKDSGIDNNIVNDIIELLTHKNDSVKDFTKNLILQQMSFGGIQKAKQFIKHIPPHYLKYLGVYDNVNLNLYDLDSEAFVTQYIQHNPHLVASKELWDMFRRGEIRNTRESIVLPESDLSESILHNPRLNFISILQSNGKYMLFKRDSLNPSRFVSIPLLGKGNIREYSLNETIAESQFDENNPREGWYKVESMPDNYYTDNYSQIRSVINDKLALGISNPDSEEAIVKICK